MARAGFGADGESPVSGNAALWFRNGGCGRSTMARRHQSKIYEPQETEAIFLQIFNELSWMQALVIYRCLLVSSQVETTSFVRCFFCFA
jgi:hypothetical protein